MKSCRLTLEARCDLLEIRDYIMLDNRTAAERLMRLIHAKCRFVGQNPELKAPQKRLNNLCRYVVGSYLIFYRPAAGGVEIIRVLHASRDIESILSKIN